jgi:hypothetical protein
MAGKTVSIDRDYRNNNCEKQEMQITALVTFSGYLIPGDHESDSDPDAAAIALRKAGYTVARLPERLRLRLTFPGDDFMWVAACGVITEDWKVVDAVMNQIQSIVDEFGGLCDKGGLTRQTGSRASRSCSNRGSRHGCNDRTAAQNGQCDQ